MCQKGFLLFPKKNLNCSLRLTQWTYNVIGKLPGMQNKINLAPLSLPILNMHAVLSMDILRVGKEIHYTYVMSSQPHISHKHRLKCTQAHVTYYPLFP